MDEDEAAAAVFDVLPEDLPEVVHLEVQGGADGEAVQFQLIEVLAEADKGRRVVGVHHANLLTLEKALVPGMLLFLASELHGAFPRLVLLRFRLWFGLQVLLNDAEVFEVGEFHEGKITKECLSS